MPSLRQSCPDKITEVINSFPQKQSASIPLLHLAWKEYGYISPEAMEEVAEILNMEPAQIEGIASFYTMFPLKPLGKYHIEFCTNISCHLRGAKDVVKHIQNKLGIHSGETTADGKFSMQKVECLAACSWAPCMQINGKEYQNVSAEEADKILATLD